MHRLARLSSLAVVAVIGTLVLLMEVEAALHKAFWVDEGYEIVETCRKPLPRMLLEGARECSPAPLYWLAQSAVVRSVDTADLSLRVKYRAVSLAAATLTVVALLLGLQHRLGLAAALAAAASLVTQPAFHHYAAQNRAYMTWVLVTALLVLAAAALVPPREAEARPWRRRTLLAAGVLAGLAAVPGAFQAAGAFAAAALAWAALAPRGLDRRAWLVLAAAAAGILALDVHYWSGSVCRAYTGAGHLDVLGAGPHRAALFRQVAALFWPDTAPWSWPGHLAAILGAAAPLLLWRRRARLDEGARFAFALALAALSQILAALPVAAGLAAGHYLFLPRMFIFLLVARAVLVGVGVFTAAAWVRDACPPRARLFVSVGVNCAAIAVTAHALTVADVLAKSWHFPLPPGGGLSCEALRGSSAQVLHRKADHDFAFTPNFLARAGAALRECPADAPADGPRYLVALDGAEGGDWAAVADAPPPGFEPMLVCGAPVSLGPGGRLVR